MGDPKAQEIRMVGLPLRLHEQVAREATHRRMTTRELVAEMVRDYFEQQDGMFNGSYEDDEDLEMEWY